jgi:hypothetical protein
MHLAVRFLRAVCARMTDAPLFPLSFRGISDFPVKAMIVEIGRVSITISLCLDEYAQFCGGAWSWPIA